MRREEDQMPPEPKLPPAELKLLHIEDDDGDAKAVQRALHKEFKSPGCTILRVVTLAEALAKLQIEHVDAVLLDLTLPDVQGVASVIAIQDANPDVPIVVLSGHDDNQLALQAVRHGAQEYLVKDHSNSRMMGLAVLSSIERKIYERSLYKQANYDELTGLPNRRMFLEYMQRWLLRASRWKRSEAVMFMDVNGFKKVNDTLGHEVGDKLLKLIATRLTEGLRNCDMVARYAGDEFVVHVDADANVTNETCTVIAEKIAALLKEPIIIDGHRINTGLSIGIAFFPDHGSNVAELIHNADQAMYDAKKAQKGHSFAPGRRPSLGPVLRGVLAQRGGQHQH